MIVVREPPAGIARLVVPPLDLDDLPPPLDADDPWVHGGTTICLSRLFCGNTS